MPTATGLVTIKKMPYRNETDEEWSNKYWFSGVIPADETAWLGLFTEIANLEKACFPSDTSIVRAYGYDNSDPGSPAVWVYNLEEVGTPIQGTLVKNANEYDLAGDQAVMVWWKTSRRNARGKWIYLRKYMHGGVGTIADGDAIGGSMIAPLGNLALKLMDGTLTGGRRIRSAAQDEVIQEAEASAWVTTRTLKRRGKRTATTTP